MVSRWWNTKKLNTQMSHRQNMFSVIVNIRNALSSEVVKADPRHSCKYTCDRVQQAEKLVHELIKD